MFMMFLNNSCIQNKGCEDGKIISKCIEPTYFPIFEVHSDTGCLFKTEFN